MRIQIESTSKIVVMNGVECRAWEGATEDGTPIIAFIVRVAVPEGLPAEAYSVFEEQLKETRKPTPELAGNPCWDARLVV